MTLAVRVLFLYFLACTLDVNGDQRGIIGNLLGFGNNNKNNNANLPNSPYLQPPNMVVQDPKAPSINIPGINNQQGYPSYNRPSLLGGLLAGSSILNMDKDKDQNHQPINMNWINYAVQKCAKFDTRKLTTILPSASNGLTEPKMYYFANATSDMLTWEDAQVYCAANGMELVTINNAAENAIIKDKMKEILGNSVPPAPGNTNQNQFWIGYQDVNKNDAYHWIGDGSSTFTDWSTTPAPGFNGCATIEQHTLTDNIHMSAYACTALDKFRYICEVNDECMALLMSLVHQHKHKPHLHLHGVGDGYGSY